MSEKNQELQKLISICIELVKNKKITELDYFLEDTLNTYPDFLQEKMINNLSLLEVLINSYESKLLKKYANYIDISAKNSTGYNYGTQLIKKSMTSILELTLKENPQLINSKNSNGISMIEYLIDSHDSKLLQKYVEHIDFNLKMNSGVNLVTYLIQKSMLSIVELALEYHPELMNEKNSNGIYTIEYIIDSYNNKLIDKYAEYVNLSLITNNGMNVASYLIKKSMITTLDKALKYNPEAINEKNANNISTIEYLIDSYNNKLLEKYAEYVNLNVLMSNGLNISTYLIKKSMFSTLDILLKYKPDNINGKNSNGIHTVEYLIDSYNNKLLEKYAEYINLEFPSSDKGTLCTYMMKKSLYKTALKMVEYNPEVLGKCGKNKVLPLDLIMKDNQINLFKEYLVYLKANDIMPITINNAVNTIKNNKIIINKSNETQEIIKKEIKLNNYEKNKEEVVNKVEEEEETPRTQLIKKIRNTL